MYSDIEILYALASDSKGYASQCYQKLVERSFKDVEDLDTPDMERLEMDSARSKVRESME